MEKDPDGKLKYVGGIPYLTSRDIRIEPDPRRPRGWQRVEMFLFTGWFGTLILWVLLLGAVVALGLFVDLILIAVRD